MTPARAAATALLLVGLGCEAPAGEATDAATETPEWTLVRELTIGSVDDPDQALTAVDMGVLPHPDGTLWIHQIDDGQFRAYDAAGGFLGVVGQPGDGPGELTGIREFGWWGGGRDTVWVRDAARGVTLFTADGRYARRFTFEPAPFGDDLRVPEPEHFFADGTALGAAEHPVALGPRSLVRYDPLAGTVLHEVARLERDVAARLYLRGEGGARLQRPIPDEELVALAPGGDWLVVVDRGAAGALPVDTLHVYALDVGGDTLWSRRDPYETRPVPAAEADSILDAYTTGLGGRGAGARVPRDELRQAVSDAIGLPGHRPAARTVFVGEDDHVWLGWSAAPGAPDLWWVVAPDGAHAAVVRSPRRLDVRAASATHLWAVERDELDVEYVVRYRIERAASP